VKCLFDRLRQIFDFQIFRSYLNIVIRYILYSLNANVEQLYTTACLRWPLGDNVSEIDSDVSGRKSLGAPLLFVGLFINIRDYRMSVSISSLPNRLKHLRPSQYFGDSTKKYRRGQADGQTDGQTPHDGIGRA